MEADIAEGDDLVFYNKYGDQGLDDVDDDSFDNGYYF